MVCEHHLLKAPGVALFVARRRRAAAGAAGDEEDGDTADDQGCKASRLRQGLCVAAQFCTLQGEGNGDDESLDSVLHQMPDGINAMSYGDTRT